MDITSIAYLLFFPAVVLLYNLVPQKLRLYLLLIASYAFYISMQSTYALLLAAVTLTTFFTVWGLGKVADDKKRLFIMWAGIAITILPLFFFKYFDALGKGLGNLMGFQFTPIALMLPIGISFYTFMAIGYIVDAYNEEIEQRPNLASTGLFLSFFPLVLSGPIERADNMLPQFQKLQRSTYEDITKGAKTMLWGYFMKLCVANQLAMYCNAVFANVVQHNGTSLALASLLHPIQTYCDLGGYSLIAIGTAQCLGIKIIPNFCHPFFAISISDFWHRWHMSLIQWLTDYIFTPVSFALRHWKLKGVCVAMIITFIVSGLWHGATAACVLWGLFQSVFLCIDLISQKRRTVLERSHNLNHRWWWILPCAVVTYLINASSLIFAHGATLSESWTIFRKIVSNPGTPFIDISSLACGLAAFAVVFAKDFIEEFHPGSKVNGWFSSAPVCMFLLVLILLIGVFDGGAFIYFQF